MEVEPNVLHRAIAQTVHQLLELLAEHLLRSLLIDQVHQTHVVVALLQVVDVLPTQLAIDAIVSDDVALGRPLQIWLLLPLERHRATGLHEAEHRFDAVAIGEEHLFGFGGVGGVPVEVGASADPTCSLPAFIPPRKYHQLARVPTERAEVDDDEPADESRDPFDCADPHEVLHPSRIVEEVFVAARHRAITLDELLQAVGEVVLLAIVELLLVEEGC